jgi:23S rRNA pseudouridine1911/1915/1917 synthase
MGTGLLCYTAAVELSPRSAVVDEDEHEATLAAIVRAMYSELSWTKARDLVRSGRVRVEGELRFDPAERMASGTKIDVNPTGPRRRAPALEHHRIVHVDHDVVVVSKPANLLTVPWDEHDDRDTLIERTRLALRELGAGGRGKTGRAGEHDRLGVVQRLDKDTTGLLVFARNRGARKALESQLRAHTIERRYVALVWGHAEAAIHETWLMPDRGDGLRGSWRGPSTPPKVAKKAITKVRVEERLTGATSISCQLETGRQHQIRIHMAEDGHPLVGEAIYDRGYRGPRVVPAGVRVERPMLHAASLGFVHPSTDRPIRFEDPIPDDLQAVLEGLRKS